MSSSTQRISSLLSQLEQLAPQKSSKDDLHLALDDLEPLVEQHGLDASQLHRGYNLALGGQLAPSLALSLLPLLLPRSPLSPQPILRLISTLGEASHTKPPHYGQVDYRTQSKALAQLCVLLELGAVSKEGKAVLERFWGLIEKGLEYGALRDVTASLLCLITRRSHVTQPRIENLQRTICAAAPCPPSLLRLLDVYRSFFPELVSSAGSRPVRPARRTAVMEEWADKVRGLLRGGQGEMDSNDGRDAKRRKTAHADIPSGATFDGSGLTTPLSDIRSISQLVSSISQLDMPSQAGSILHAVPGTVKTESVRGEEHRVKAWAFLSTCAFDGDPEYVGRLTAWTTSMLKRDLYELDETAETEARVEDLLCRVRELCEMGGELLDGLEPFVAELLMTWDGEAHREVVFDLIALIKPSMYEIFYGHILLPLQQLSVTADAQWLSDLLGCFTDLVLNLAVRDDWHKEDAITAFGVLPNDGSYTASLQAVVEFVDHLICNATQTFPNSVLLRTASLGFYEAVLTLPLAHNLQILVIPTATFTYSCFLAEDIMSISRICGIIASLREALTGEMTAMDKDDPSNIDLVSFLNAYLVDFTNALWQKRFLSDQQGAAALNMTGPQLAAVKEYSDKRGHGMSASLGLGTHGAFALLARDYLSKLEADADTIGRGVQGPVSIGSLKDLEKRGGLKLSFNDFRARFVEHLETQGATGLHTFLFTSLQSLINRRQSFSTSPKGTPV